MQGHNHCQTKPAAPRKRGGGRPPAAQAGDVDRRILEAATRLFLAQGFDVTNCEQVAAEAGAGKASLYARYANKDELFAAVVHRSVHSMLAWPIDHASTDLPVAERLSVLGRSILGHMLEAQVVALMRVVITTGYRFPELARSTDAIGRDRGVQLVAEAIAGAQAGAPAVLERAKPAAVKFVEIAVLPMQMRALLATDVSELAAEIGKTVDDAVEMLIAGRWLESWA